MTDDLKRRLREPPTRYGTETQTEVTIRRHRERSEAADRIAALEAQLQSVLDREAATQARHDAKLDALEAQLAAARAGLTPSPVDASHAADPVANAARVLLDQDGRANPQLVEIAEEIYDAGASMSRAIGVALRHIGEVDHAPLD